MITIEDLKKEVGAYNYEILTQRDDSVALRAIEKARIWLLAKFQKCGEAPDFENEIVKTAWLERALYELYAIAEQEEKAKDKKENAEELLSALIGDCAKEEVREISKKPYAFVKEGRKEWEEF